MTTAAKAASGPGGTDRYAARRSPVSTRRTPPPPRSHRQPVPRGRRSHRDAASHSSSRALTHTRRRRPLPPSTRNETPCQILVYVRDATRVDGLRSRTFFSRRYCTSGVAGAPCFRSFFHSVIYFVSVAAVITAVAAFGVINSSVKTPPFPSAVR